ncbi:MAG TPA: hypothetical protein VIU62_09780 [Chloroflexota bacterium]|jgi:hypothetical protein
MADPVEKLAGGDSRTPAATVAVVDPNQSVTARALAAADAVAAEKRLDYAPDGGRFLRSDGVLVDFDGVPVKEKK